MSKFKKDQFVLIRQTGKKGRVEEVLYNPYLPTWMCSPNYLVMIDGERKVFVKKDLKRIK